MRLGHVFHSVECVSIREDPKEDRIRVIQGVPKKENYFREDITSKLGQPHPSNLRCLKVHLVEIKCA